MNYKEAQKQLDSMKPIYIMEYKRGHKILLYSKSQIDILLGSLFTK